MNKLFRFISIAFAIFFMVGCNPTETEVVTELPNIILNGDSRMEVLLNSNFVDPGAQILGGFDLDLVIESDVDTSVLGEYTITYKITYLEEDYTISRTVVVVSELLGETPSLSFIGAETMQVEQNSEFVDPGVTLIGQTGLDITVDSNVDTSALGTYTIVYTITYLGVDYSLTRTVEVVAETIAVLPAIELIGSATIQVEKDSTFVDPGAVVVGDFDLDIDVTSNVDIYKIGEYTITYSITYLTVEYSVSRAVEVIAPIVLLPSLELVGEAFVEIDKDFAYADPGAIVIGDFDLDIVISSNLDVYKVGEYTITYTITYLEVEYSVSRTVSVVELPYFEITLDYSNVSYHSVVVNLTVIDASDMLSNRFVQLFDGDDLVQSEAYVTGVNTIEVTGLDDSTLYEIVVTGQYVENDNPVLVTGYSTTFSTLTMGELSFTKEDVFVGVNNIDFGLLVVDEDDVLTDLEVNIYDGDTLVESINIYDDIYIGELEIGSLYAWVNFEGLDEETTYNVEIEYMYQLAGEIEEVQVLLGKVEYTTGKASVPVVLSNDVRARYYAISGVIDIDFTDYESVYVWATLYEGDTYKKSFTLENDYTTYVFEYLSIDTDYRIDVYADYTRRSDDVMFSDVLLGSYDTKTLFEGELAPPVVENVVVTSTTSSVTVEFDLTDVDYSMEIGYARLYLGSSSKGSEEIAVGHNTITFDSSIYDNSLYTIKIAIDYNGDGSYPTLYQEDIYTLPTITLNSFEQTEMFFAGDDVVMKLDINNSDDVTIDFVMINGIRYSEFLFPSNNEVIYISLGAKNVATYPISLQNVVVTLGDQELEIALVSNQDVTVFEVGSIDPEDATVVVLDIVPAEYFVTVDKYAPTAVTPVAIDIYIENKYNLPINSITIGGIEYLSGDITIITPSHIQVVADFSYEGGSNNTLYFSNITFERNGIVETNTQAEHVSVDVYKIFDYDLGGLADVVHISTPAEFLAIVADPANPQRVFVLDNDIDLAGLEYTPIGTYENPFTGGFNGNGYTVSNVTINQSLDILSKYYYIGLFGYSRAFISDLTVDNININVVSTIDNTLYVGALAGIQLGVVYDVQVTNSSITIDGVSTSYIGGLAGEQHGDIIRSSADTAISVVVTDATRTIGMYVGGLVGNKAYEDVRNSYATGDITIALINPSTVIVGGLAGEVSNGGSSDPSYIVNSYATGNISTTADYYSRIGGLIGTTGSALDTSVIENSFATGNIQSSAGTMGGLIGSTYVQVNSSFATGSVNGNAGTIGRLFGSANQYKLDTIYTYDDQVVTRNSVPTNGSDYYYSSIGVATSEQFDDLDYYVEFLGWSTHFFDFSNLDVASNYLPVLAGK